MEKAQPRITPTEPSDSFYSNTPKLTMESCPKFHKCNSPICPLDAIWHKRSNHKEDSTCFYLIESVKHDAEAHFKVAQLGELYELICHVRSDISIRHNRIAAKLESAKKTGSRMIRKFGGNYD